jgi:uncharacterized membrane protein YhaH (DUF805 family)
MSNNYTYNLFFSRMFSFKGRSNRKEYFARSLLYIFIFVLSFSMPHIMLEKQLESYHATYLLGLLCFLCFQDIALRARRLHDLNASGWWQLIVLIPFGQLLLIFLALKKGTPTANKYGEPPKYKIY